MPYHPSDPPVASPPSGGRRAGRTEDDTIAKAATATFTEHRDLLFSIVYNMLGSATDAQDVLQETWLSWMTRNRASGAEDIHNPRSYLVRIAVNRALDHQATLSRRRETYVGPWLPEPITTPHLTAPATHDAADAADTVIQAESVSMALLVVLETLSPLERSVFVLHEVFGYSHAEIGTILDRSATAIRQLAHRAREHVHARRPRYEPDPATRQQVTAHFLAAARNGNVNALLKALAPEVTLFGDGGGKTHTAGGLRAIHGRDKVARILINSARRFGQHLTVSYHTLNGGPSALMANGHTTHAVITLDLTRSNQIQNIYIIVNPDKLTHLK